MKSLVAFIAALATGAVLALVSSDLRAAGDVTPTPAPAWQLKDVDGRVVTSDQFKHQVVVLDFWATWCGPCRSEIPGYVALQKKYAAEGVTFVGVSVDQAGPEVVRKFVADEKIDYPIVMGDDQVAAAFGGVEAIPTTFIIDRNGLIRFRKVGAMTTEEFEMVLKRFLR